MMTFWERFTELCAQNNTTPNAVCKELGKSNATATHWKNGSVPKGDILSEISQYFNVSVDYLLGNVDIPDPLHGLEFAFEGEVNDFTEEERQDLIDFVRYIKSKRKDQPPQK